MKSALLVLVALAGLSAHDASACKKESDTTINLSCDGPTRLADRYDADEARFAIVTDNRKVMLLITDDVVAMQLSDRVLRKVSRKMRDAKDEDDGALAQAIRTAVLAGVRSALDHSAECDIRDIARADYRDGELILTGRNGKRLFGNAEIDGENVMRHFSPSDARAFVRQLRQRMGRNT